MEDIRYAVRLLLRQPVFTFTVLLALALGIGANSAIFSVVNSVLLRPLPYREPDRLYFLWTRNLERNRPQLSFSAHDLLDLQRQAGSFASVSGIYNYSATQTGEGEPLRLMLSLVSPNYFDTLGIPMLYGRSFQAREGVIGDNHVVILTHGFWKRRYGSDPAVLGRTTMLDGELHTIVGILPELHGDNRNNDAFIPLAFGETEMGVREARYLSVIARLKPDASVPQAEAELDSLAARFAEVRPEANKGCSFYMVPAQVEATSASRQALLVLAASVALVLLITCANLASLLLVRAAGRQKEVAVRTAMGANRRRIVRQLLTESVVIAVAGGLLGLAVAYAGLRAIQAYAPTGVSRLQQAEIDLPTLGFTFLVSILTGVLFGSAPALQTIRVNLSGVLREESRGTSGGISKSRTRALLVIFEVALAAVLLVCAGLLVRSLYGLTRVDPGFRTAGVLTLRTTLPDARYQKPEDRNQYVRRVLERLESVPGVVSASLTTALPMMQVNWWADFTIEGRPAPNGEREKATYSAVTPRYFETLGIPVTAGRAFNERDTPDRPPVLMVTETFARQYFPGDTAIGKHIHLKVTRFESVCQIVGVVADTRHLKLDEPPRAAIYQPHAQLPWPFLAFAVRTNTDPAGMAPVIRRAFFEVDPEQPVDRVMTLQKLVDGVLAQQKLAMSLLVVFAGVAVLLAAIGIYGLLAFTVAQRGREMGIRVALGASAQQLMSMIIRQGLSLTLGGVVAGLLVAPLASRALRGLLYGVKPFDVPTFAVVGLLLLFVAFLACLVPSWRAMRVDPATSLRYD